jgi:hypothetical protein
LIELREGPGFWRFKKSATATEFLIRIAPLSGARDDCPT